MTTDLLRGGRFWRLLPWLIAAFLLLLPLGAMQITDEVAWDAADFILMGAMLLAACGACECAARMATGIAYRAAAAIAIAAAYLLVWINLAVGIIGTEGNPANLMFAGVLAVGFVAAILARFRPRGMARALVAIACAQALAGAIALYIGWKSESANWPLALVILTAVLVALWALSAWLFRKAAQEPAAL
jgi:hypothetical protein